MWSRSYYWTRGLFGPPFFDAVGTRYFDREMTVLNGGEVGDAELVGDDDLDRKSPVMIVVNVGMASCTH